MDFERIELPREIAPPPELRPRTAAQLRRSHLLHPRRAPIIAVAAVLAVGAAFSAVTLMRHPAPPRANYILLLYESPDFVGGNRAEYGRWARQMRPFVVGGEELGGNPILTTPGLNTPAPSSQPRLAGYFLIGAKDDASAARVARACPHLRHGGAIVLRRIVL